MNTRTLTALLVACALPLTIMACDSGGSSSGDDSPSDVNSQDTVPANSSSDVDGGPSPTGDTVNEADGTPVTTDAATDTTLPPADP